MPSFRTQLSHLLALGLLIPSAARAGTLYGDAADCGVRSDGAILGLPATSLIAGGAGSSPQKDRSAVFVYQLPNLGAITDPFVAASLTFDFIDTDGTPPNADLYGLGRRAGATVLSTDYYGETTAVDPTDATFLQDNILLSGTAPGLVTTNTTGSTALRDYLNAQYAAGAGAGQYVFLRLSTDSPVGGVNRYNLTASEGGAVGPPDTRPRIDYAIPGDATPVPYNVTEETYTTEVIYAGSWATGDIPTKTEGKVVATYGNHTYVIIQTGIEVSPGVFKPRCKLYKISLDGLTVTEAWLDTQSPTYYTSDTDGHHYMTLGIDEDGYLHVSGDMHVYPQMNNNLNLPSRFNGSTILYWRSAAPEDITNFVFKGSTSGERPVGTNHTYPEFFNDNNGKLYFKTRQHLGGPVPASLCLSVYDKTTGTWSALGGTRIAQATATEDGTASYNLPTLDLRFDSSNRLHLSTLQLNEPYPRPSTGIPLVHGATDLMYAYSSNGGTTLRKYDGSTFTYPITPAKATVLAHRASDNVPPANVPYFMSTQLSMSLDRNEQPVATFIDQALYDSGDSEFVFVSRNATDTGWTETWNNWSPSIKSEAQAKTVGFVGQDPQGVHTLIGRNTKVTGSPILWRFWDVGSPHTTLDIDASGPGTINGMEGGQIDEEYQMATGNLQFLASTNNSTWKLVRITINRPAPGSFAPATTQWNLLPADGATEVRKTVYFGYNWRGSMDIVYDITSVGGPINRNGAGTVFGVDDLYFDGNLGESIAASNLRIDNFNSNGSGYHLADIIPPSFRNIRFNSHTVATDIATITANGGAPQELSDADSGTGDFPGHLPSTAEVDFHLMTGTSAVTAFTVATSTANTSVDNKWRISDITIEFDFVDLLPPAPDPMTFASLPAAVNHSIITMTATTATDDRGGAVQYRFTCLEDPAKTSSWQTAETYVATGLLASTLYTFRVEARDTSLNATGLSAPAAAMTGPLPPYDAWEITHGIAGSGRTGDADDDRFTNEYEYYFGQDPKSGQNLRKPTTSIVNDGGSIYPALTYTRRIDLPGDITYAVETSDDLVTWTPRNVGAGASDLTIVTGPTDNLDETETIQVRSNTDVTSLPGTKLFFRIVATE